MSRLTRPLVTVLALSCGAVPPARAAAEPPLSALTLTGPERTLFSATRDACDGYTPVVEPHTHGTTWGPWWNLQDWTPRS